MNAKASISNGYRWRLGIIALACLGFSAWFFYDGAVAYPEQKRVYEAYMDIQDRYPSDWNQRWVELAAENGWSTTETPKPKTDTDILTQFIFGGIMLPIGLLFLFSFIRASGRWIAGDEQGLHTSWGQHAPWDAITSIDKTRWKSKGIAIVHYRDPASGGSGGSGGGTERRITLDDWKYEREPTTALVAAVDQRLGNTTPASETPAPDAEEHPTESATS